MLALSNKLMRRKLAPELFQKYLRMCLDFLKSIFEVAASKFKLKMVTLILKAKLIFVKNVRLVTASINS